MSPHQRRRGAMLQRKTMWAWSAHWQFVSGRRQRRPLDAKSLIYRNQSSAVRRGTHCQWHVGPVPHVSESSPSVLQRRLIPNLHPWQKCKETWQGEVECKGSGQARCSFGRGAVVYVHGWTLQSSAGETSVAKNRAWVMEAEYRCLLTGALHQGLEVQ
jgi:hypothetical protein